MGRPRDDSRRQKWSDEALSLGQDLNGQHLTEFQIAEELTRRYPITLPTEIPGIRAAFTPRMVLERFRDEKIPINSPGERMSGPMIE